MKKKEAGITLVALIVTIIVLLIIAGVSIASGIAVAKTAKDNKMKAELQMVQHAALEQFHKYQVTQDESILVGTKKTLAEAKNILPTTGITIPTKSEGYYLLNSENLSSIGLQDAEENAQYLVNYETGMVYNVTQKTTSEGDYLYLPETEEAEYIIEK